MPQISYIFLRGLEIEGSHPHDVGAWHITVRRMEFGEGVPLKDDPLSMVEFESGQPYPPAPKLPQSHLMRFFYYRRIRSAAEAERHLQMVDSAVPVSVYLFASWAKPPLKDVIPMPRDGELPLRDTHLVVLRRCSPEQRAFFFTNTWGEAWGNTGWAALSYEYVNKYTFESWVTHHESQVSLESSRKARVANRLERRWVARDEWSRRIYGFEVWDEHEKERQAWSFVLETADALEIEELYVRPEFRRRGLGKVLADKVRALAKAKRMPLRAWVPFADCRQENPSNYPAVVAIARLLGLQFQSCPEIWAAYYATDEQPGSDFPVEPARMPARPRTSLQMVLAAALAMAGTPDQQTLSVPAAAARQETSDFPEPGTKAWGELNRRRGELIRKKNREGLTAEEQVEYERLQREVQATLKRKHHAPDIWEKRIAEIEQRLKTEKGAEPE
ncbi:MAG: GNAT family N-acetyltransferase [Gemmataceae bacterium]